MMKGTKNSGHSASKTVATVGYTSRVPVKGSTNSGYSASKTVATVGYNSRFPVKGSKNTGHSAPKSVATAGHISNRPVKTTVIFQGTKGAGGGEGSYETKSRISSVDNRTGCYRRTTTKEKVSAGEFHSKNGTSGVKGEYKKSSTVRIGNNGGYTEVYTEKRVRNVSFNKNGSNSKNFLTR